jgi:hypothetical protein
LVQGDRLIDEILADLDAVEREARGKLLKLSEASRACGYTPDHLRVLIRSGKLTDYGRPHAPRVRLDELPKKPGHNAGVATPARAVARLQERILGTATPVRKRNGNAA